MSHASGNYNVHHITIDFIVFWMNEKILLMKPLTTTSWLSKQQKQTTNQVQLIA